MKKTIIAFIVNRTSGRKKHLSIEKLVEKNLDNQQFETIFYYSKARYHCTELAMEASKNAGIVVAVGGDGTINEVASALLNTKIPLAIIPAGSGNGIARNFGIPMDFEKAIKLLNNHQIIKADTGTINGKPFFATAGCGFDAHIAKAFASSKTRGFKTYIKMVLNEFQKFKPLDIQLIVDGNETLLPVFMATVANGKQFGNNAFISPTAKYNDGLLNLTLIKPFPISSVIGLALKLFSKKIEDSPFVETFVGREITIIQKNMFSHYDGEPFESGNRLTFKLCPLSLNIVIDK